MNKTVIIYLNLKSEKIKLTNYIIPIYKIPLLYLGRSKKYRIKYEYVLE